MSIWLITLLASFLFIATMSTIIWWRQHHLAKKHGDNEGRLCGCSSACSEHLYQISEPSAKPK